MQNIRNPCGVKRENIRRFFQDFLFLFLFSSLFKNMWFFCNRQFSTKIQKIDFKKMFLIWFFIFNDSNDLKIKLWRLGGSWLLLLNKVFRSNPAGYFIHTASVSRFLSIFLFLSLCQTQSLFLFFKHNMFLSFYLTFSLLPIFSFPPISFSFFLSQSPFFLSFCVPFSFCFLFHFFLTLFLTFSFLFICSFLIFLLSPSFSLFLLTVEFFFP